MSDFEETRTRGPVVVSLTDAAATDRALVGGKGANLAQLLSAGLPVPDGFCVTTIAYRHLIDESLRDAIDALATLDSTDTAAIADAGATLRERIESRPFPDAVEEQIEAMLSEVRRTTDETYAVRSSATAEDLPTASFAGQQETFLNVAEADVVDRVRACMASLFTDRAIAYRANNDIPHEDVAVAVVVQRMVTPDRSGILFTADPLTGNRTVMSIDAGFGLGDALVSGAATADTVRVDARTGEFLEYEVGDQQLAVRAHAGGGTETVELPPGERDARVLSVEQVRTLVDVGNEIEALFDSPQDIEWCLTDGELAVVQARPITSLFPVPSPRPADGRLHVYISMGHGQSFAEAMPPLVLDLWKAYVQALFTELGFDPGTQWAVEAGGRIYMDMTPFLRIERSRERLPERMAEANEPMGTAIDDLLTRRVDEFRHEQTLRERLISLPTSAGTMWNVLRSALPELLRMSRGFGRAFVGAPAPLSREEARCDAWGEDAAAQIRAPDEVGERVRTVFDVPKEAVQYPSMGLLIAGFAAERQLERRFPDAVDDVTAVGRGLPEEMVTKLNLGIGDLADVARESPAVVAALERGASLETIESVAGGAQFRSALVDYLDTFGHRATGEIDISRPRWRDDPSVLLTMVRSTVAASEAGEHRQHLRALTQDALAAAERLEQRAVRRSFGPIRRRLVRHLIRTYRTGIQTREYPKHGAAHIFAAWHEVLHDAGEQLAAQGRLATVDDVWLLRKEELFDLLDGNSVAVDFDSRRAEFDRYASLDAPPVVTSEGEALTGHIDQEDVPEGALVGTGVSAGVVEGVARVVRDPGTETIEKGEVLVAPSSDPGWTPLFLNAAGIVVEVGGQMSHGSLVAREYGLPAVVAVPEATRKIETGQRVRVDGTNGIVELLE